MQQRLIAILLQNNREWWSKLMDGVLASIALILLWLTIVLSVRPIEVMFGPPGLLVYVLVLLAVSMFSLQESLVSRHSDTTRSWYGIIGGFLAWLVVEVMNHLGVPLLPNLAGIILLLMVSMIVGLLWRNILPLGVRFFSLTFLLNWTEYIFMHVQGMLAHFSPIFTLTYRATGFLAIFFVILVLGWILFQSRRRIQRVSGSLTIWFLASLALYVFWGALF